LKLDCSLPLGSSAAVRVSSRGGDRGRSFQRSLHLLRVRIAAMSRSGQPPDLKKYMDKKLQIKLNANRVVVGTLRGFDQFMNLVVDNTVEVNGNDKTDIGMVVIRGNSVVMIEALEPVAKSQ
ncbi:unnamed protein product, partial [Urochloa humidicola]